MGPCIQDIPLYTEIIKDISKKRNKLLFVPFCSLSKNPGIQEENPGDLAYMGLKIVRM